MSAERRLYHCHDFTKYFKQCQKRHWLRLDESFANNVRETFVQSPLHGSSRSSEDAQVHKKVQSRGPEETHAQFHVKSPEGRFVQVV